MPSRTVLKRSVSISAGKSARQTIVTLADAMRYLDAHGGDDPRWMRTRRALEDAKATGSLRKIRQATRAFEEAVEELAPGSVAVRIPSLR
jgi:hypothetical protein